MRFPLLYLVLAWDDEGENEEEEGKNEEECASEDSQLFDGLW